jgi:hypothetical protein
MLRVSKEKKNRNAVSSVSNMSWKLLMQHVLEATNAVSSSVSNNIV